MILGTKWIGTRANTALGLEARRIISIIIALVVIISTFIIIIIIIIYVLTRCRRAIGEDLSEGELVGAGVSKQKQVTGGRMI